MGFRGFRRRGRTGYSRLRRGCCYRGLLGRVCLFNQLIGDVIFVDVTHVPHWFLADPRCRDPLDIVEPQIRVELFRLRFATQRLDFARSRVVRGESKEVAVLVVELYLLKYSSISCAMYLAPAWTLGSAVCTSPTPSSRPVFGMICIRPTAPTQQARLGRRGNQTPA